MEYSRAQLAVGASGSRSQSNSPTSCKSACPYEEHVVTDPNVSRIMLMMLRDFVHREAVYVRAEDEPARFSCPIMRCYKDFDRPMDLIGHMLECKQLRFGEFNCLRCKDWHRYPITEREWRKWEGWQAEAPPAISIKKKLSEISDTIGRAIRSPRRSSAPSSHGGSPGTVVKSPGPPDYLASSVAVEPISYGRMSPSPSQDLEEKWPASSESASELRVVPWSPSWIVAPVELPLCNLQNSSGSFLSVPNGGPSGGSSQSMSDMPGSPCGSSPSSLGSSQVTAPQLQVSTQQSPVQCFNDIARSTEGMSAAQVAREPVWPPMPPPGYAGGAASTVNPFLPYPGSQMPTADCNSVPAIGQALTSNKVNTRNPQDSSPSSWPHDQMPPPQELADSSIQELAASPPRQELHGDCLSAEAIVGVYFEAGDSYLLAPDQMPSPQELVGNYMAQEPHGDYMRVPQDTTAAINVGAVDSYLPAPNQMPPPQEQDGGYIRVPLDTTAAIDVGAVDSYLPGSDQISVYDRLDLADRANDYKCETCGWQPRKTGKRKNWANYLRKHRNTVHSGQRFSCRNPSCGKSYTRQDNLAKHVRESHPGSLGGPNGFLSSFQTRSANKRRSNR
ncbi:hypothetical protein MAPG_02926 [Magnaporthiopsis poae ATCC 64411]|uniref:C2H2-type domain-containing protein n=1 Tax=Magnaporthiopsis poae (strain ATCC 64411 / 73-15) TaxID=644358 RepID=A0A0C4DSP1_MAGP6|nr:hypothetical protein MAPG_02926 [Magnaporthiopsis poae ATCC 64411]